MESTDSSSGSQQQPQLPPGFRFHPTDEELVVHYLKKKAAAAPLPAPIIAEVDLYKFDPWELPAKAIFGEQEWYFFSPRDRKYPNGTRPNRAATSGYWKATGTDKPVMTGGGTQRVGVKKALVFYGGKPPKGIKTSWIMHEYRLADNKPTPKPPGCDFTNKKASLRLDDWVLCRIYKKNNAQRPVDQQRDDLHDVIGPMINIPPTISFPIGQNHKLGLENEPSMYDSTMGDAMNSMCSSGSRGLNNLLPAKRTLPNMYWNDDRNQDNSPTTKRFLSENNCDDPNTSNPTMANILNQMPHQTTTLHQQQQQAMLGNIGDGDFEQQGYQVPGMNWYT